MNGPGHEMILASAGSGKTYALTNRVVRLLALGAPPDRIVALTFTRRAAGEFFDVILRKLARAAAAPGYAAQLSSEIDQSGFDSADYLRLLRGMVDAMPRLSFGTFDAFFARIVRSFPIELGLAGDFELLEDHAALMHRRRVLRQLFTRGEGRDGLDPAQRIFIEAFKQATHGVEQKSVESLLTAFIDRHQEVFLETPDADLWGNPGRIWPDGCDWPLDTDGEALTRATLALRARVDARPDLPDKVRARLHEFLDALMEWTPNAKLTNTISTPLENALKVWKDLRGSGATVTVAARKTRFEGDDAAALAAVVGAIIGAEMKRRIETTRGIHAVLANYESVYHQMVRRGGLLNFSDVQRLLAPDAGAPALAFSEPDDEADDRAARRLAIDWRLDARFDHWLLDEFQDTSRGQWSVLHNLIDEVVQDDSGRRTFFYVGDAKQAIYAWREGDARLMREISNHYNHEAAGVIVEKPLHQSWRSAPPLLEMVNRVFSAVDVLNELLSSEVAGRWKREWAEHTPALPGLRGHAAWIHADDEAARFKTTLDILREIRPNERGLSSAVLVQTNDAATRLANYLRKEGNLPAIAEADLHVCTDNPLTVAVLALFQAAAHPGDSLAWQHVAMTPIHAELRTQGLDTRDALSHHLLGQIQQLGYERTTATWIAAIETRLQPDDVFSRMRGRQMAEAARLFDEAGGGEVAEFIQFMQRHKLREPESAGVVRVMTIHKSKGLGFDVVVLPDLEGKSIDARREGLAVRRAKDRSPRWVLDLPSAPFSEYDPELSACVEAAKADACYDKLALLYVGLTRAKQGLYVVTQPAGTTTSRNYPRILTATLGAEEGPIEIGGLRLSGPFSTGEPDWFSSVSAITPPATELAIPHVDPTEATPAERRIPITPSHRTDGSVAAGVLFAATREADPAAFGSEVHALLASVLWWNDADAEAWLARQHAAGHTERAIAEAHACLQAAGARAVFRPDRGRDAIEVWRERSFEIILDDCWVTGVFDRVHVQRDASGAATRVDVFDFKTDQLGHAADPVTDLRIRYAGQMALYRRAAAVLTGAPRDRVRCFLVPTRGAVDPVEV